MSLAEKVVIILYNYWYIIFLVLYVINKFAKTHQTKQLMRKFHASAPVNYMHTGWFGLQATIIESRHLLNHTSIDYSVEQFNLVPFPHIHTFVSKVLGNELIMTKDPENIRVLLSSDFDKFDYGTRSSAVRPSLGMGIFTLEGENWKATRKVLKSMFDRDIISKVGVFEPHFKTLESRIDGESGCFDIQEEFMRLGLEMSTEFLFGEALSEEIPHFTEFTNAWDLCQDYMFVRLLFTGLYWVINDWRYRKCNKIVQSFCDYLVEKSLANPRKDRYVFVQELAKHTTNKSFIRDQALSMIMASRDTTAELMSFAIMELARNPDVWEKLREEVNTNFGMESPDLLTFDSLRNSKYVQAVLNETLRIYPGVPRNMKTATCNTTLPRGGGKDGKEPILVQKGQSVGLITIATQTDPEYFGADAGEFKPERWFDSSMKNLGCKYLPFNAGPRTCLGQQYTLIEASYLLVRLAQTYRAIDLQPGSAYPPRKKSLINMSAADGVFVKLYKDVTVDG
ncbi:hypothetical protein Cantr_02048 [Candida viswanathii]|uniref:Cytochrome P450 n=1 Tax=Candida viswanathii TaxID=5486 RepID=A0A367YKD3_9ASCO|nr:hypothetical protein Cantr_02048 [Candida viswanathii]